MEQPTEPRGEFDQVRLALCQLHDLWSDAGPTEMVLLGHKFLGRAVTAMAQSDYTKAAQWLRLIDWVLTEDRPGLEE